MWHRVVVILMLTTLLAGAAWAEVSVADQPAPVSRSDVVQDCADCPLMVILPRQGSGGGKPGQHIAVGQTEVTEAQFRYFLNRTGYDAGEAWQKENGAPGLPAVNVDQYAAQAYVRWLSRYTGQRYRLPSPAEWEQAAHGGLQTRYWWGDEATDGCGKEHLSQLFFPYDRQCATAPKTDLMEVASMSANPWGLYDMVGNAGEWTQDGKACGGADFSTPYHPAGCGSDFEINLAHTGLRVVRELP